MSQANEKLRILILSTPKTGNTWLSRLLSSIYDLPQAGLFAPFDPKQARGLRPEWVLFHHLQPSREILKWIDEINPVLITAVRHPADVLVSLYYHLREFQAGEIDPIATKKMLSAPFERFDIVSDAKGSFRDDLECSLSWLRTGRAHVVRYEDLWRDVRKELTRLTNLIAPVPERRIELAIERSDFSLMRRLAGDYGRFFRSGNVGSWREDLPRPVIDELGKKPYASIIAELGYSMDPQDPILTAPRVVRPSINPFKKSRASVLEGSVVPESGPEIDEEPRFDNDVPVSPLLVDVYLALCQKYKWEGNPSSTGARSYFEWLNQPCDITARDDHDQVLITNLAWHLHWLRPDLNQTFADLRGPARADYADWFVRGGGEAAELDAAFIEPMRHSLNAWAGARSVHDHEAWAWWPKLPNFAWHLYQQSKELQSVFPDILCFDRWSYLEWIIAHQQPANINPEFVEPVARSLKKLAKLRSVGRFLPGARVRIAGS